MIAQFFSTDVGSVVYLVLLAAVADLVVGVWAAVRDGTFELSAVAAVLRKHILGRVTPIFGLLLLGYLTGLTPTPSGLGQFAPTVFTAAGMGAALLYIGETFGSILDSLRQGPAPALTPAEQAAGVVGIVTSSTAPKD